MGIAMACSSWAAIAFTLAIAVSSEAGRSCQSSQSSAAASPVNCLVSMSPVRATAFQATWRGESERW